MMVDMILIALATVTTLIVSISAIYQAQKMKELVAVTNYIADLMEERMGIRGYHDD